MPILTYQKLLTEHSLLVQQFQSRLRLLSTVRLLSFIAALICGYYFFKTDQSFLLILLLLLLSGFFYLIRLYDRLKSRFELNKALVRINQTEINLLSGLPAEYENGKEYIDPHHPYSYDLDIFGEASLFPLINRTTNSFGKTDLAKTLLHPNTKIIEDRQQAIRELSDDISFRQRLQATGMLHSSEEKKIDSLTGWINASPAFKNCIVYYLLLLFPAATLLTGVSYFITGNPLYQSITGLLIVVNLGITFSFVRKIMSNISVSTDINKTLKQFSDQLILVEKQNFHSPLLVRVQSRLRRNIDPASRSISKLVSYFNSLDYFFNIFVSPLLNGFFLFHIHILFLVDKWKATHQSEIMDWLQVIGETESLSSFASFHFNNPDFSFPVISPTEDLSADSMGHPLIGKEKRINNDISFLENKFVILTGSNMSGKSTFLRTLGINLVLARAGSAVCASRFHFYDYDVYVSMRINDSLQDSESFFYAELKRLQTIIRHLDTGNKIFIILDEILRGTNSNDKHSGTVGLIHKLVSHKACGIIATHDLSVADLAAEYPYYISNKCFESEIINNELLFDYKIKDGVCTKLSASFLMKKLGIIE